jgi:drug/metabolite transporter (DMT)-like permease
LGPNIAVQIMTSLWATAALMVSLVSAVASQLLIKFALVRITREMISEETVFGLIWRGAREPSLWLGGGLLLFGALGWYTAMTRLPLSFMLPMSALIAPAVSLAAWHFQGEHLNGPKVIAIGIITAGAIWLAWLNR